MLPQEVHTFMLRAIASATSASQPHVRTSKGCQGGVPRHLVTTRGPDGAARPWSSTTARVVLPTNYCNCDAPRGSSTPGQTFYSFQLCEGYGAPVASTIHFLARLVEKFMCAAKVNIHIRGNACTDVDMAAAACLADHTPHCDRTK